MFTPEKKKISSHSQIICLFTSEEKNNIISLTDCNSYSLKETEEQLQFKAGCKSSLILCMTQFYIFQKFASI